MWRSYGWRRFAGDVAGGVIAALVALPYGLALARLMGLPPELGLFTSILTAPITALLGRNPVLIGGTARTTVPFITVAVRAQGIGGAAKVCLAASIFMMAFCVLRLAARGESAPCRRLGILVRRRRDDGDPPTPHSLRAAGIAWDSSASPIGQLASVLSVAGQSRWQPLMLGTIVVAGASRWQGNGRDHRPLCSGSRWPSSRHPCWAGENVRWGRSRWTGPPSWDSPGNRPTCSPSCRRRSDSLSSHRSIS